MNPNGILRGYEVRCWCRDNETETEICDGVINEANQTEFRLIHMEKNQMYVFQVNSRPLITLFGVPELFFRYKLLQKLDLAVCQYQYQLTQLMVCRYLPF